MRSGVGVTVAEEAALTEESGPAPVRAMTSARGDWTDKERQTSQSEHRGEGTMFVCVKQLHDVVRNCLHLMKLLQTEETGGRAGEGQRSHWG